MRLVKEIGFLILFSLAIAMAAAAVMPRVQHERQPGPHKSIIIEETCDGREK